MKTYVADTYALIFYLSEPTRLGSDARRAFSQAVHGEAEIILPVIVFAELIFAVEHGRVRVDVAAIIKQIRDVPYFRIFSLTLDRVLAIQKLTTIPELHERLIVNEALVAGAALISRDSRVRRSGVVPVVW